MDPPLATLQAKVDLDVLNLHRFGVGLPPDNVDQRPSGPVGMRLADREGEAGIVLTVAKRIAVQGADFAVGQPLVLVDQAGEGHVEDAPLLLPEGCESVVRRRNRIVGIDPGQEGAGAGEVRDRRRRSDRQQAEPGEDAFQLTDPQKRWMRTHASSSRSLEVA
jgi:hypothetical protein